MATATTISGTAFDQLPYEDGRRLELLQGEMIEVPSATWEHQRIVVQLVTSLNRYFQAEAVGDVAPDVEFALGADTRLRPDVAIVLGERASSFNPNKVPITLAPDIAVEVVSPSEHTSYSLRKIRIYLDAGVREVWQVSAETQSIFIYGSRKSGQPLDINDRLTTPLLPGWEISLREIFGVKS